MALKITNNFNKSQAFKGNASSGLSSLNALYIQNTGVQNPANAMIQPAAQFAPSAAQAAIPSGQQNGVINPLPAYMPGVGAVPSGYFMPGDDNHGSEDKIIKKTPLTGARIMAIRLQRTFLFMRQKACKVLKTAISMNIYHWV